MKIEAPNSTEIVLSLASGSGGDVDAIAQTNTLATPSVRGEKITWVKTLSGTIEIDR